MSKTIESESLLLSALILVVIALCPVLTASEAQAFQIGTGFSSSCHEQFAAVAAEERLTEEFRIGDEVAIPQDNIWRSIGDELVGPLDAGWESKSRAEKFLLTSLLIGARYPDTEGQAVTNLTESRNAHVSPADQYAHALRRPENDGPKGSRQTVEATRELIRSYVDRGQEFLDLPPERQLVTQEIYVDFYGVTEITVWAPAFYVGYAMHTMHDSFSHSVRTEDLTQILHVMNYAEAVQGELEPEVDGLAHSSAMDDCFAEEVGPIASAAEEAGADLLEAAIAQYLDSQSGEGKTVSQVLDTWLTHVEGDECTLDNKLCDSPWWDVANEEKTTSFFSVVGCQAAPGGGSSASVLLLALVALAGFAWRQARRSPRPS